MRYRGGMTVRGRMTISSSSHYLLAAKRYRGGIAIGRQKKGTAGHNYQLMRHYKKRQTFFCFYARSLVHIFLPLLRDFPYYFLTHLNFLSPLSFGFRRDFICRIKSHLTSKSTFRGSKV